MVLGGGAFGKLFGHEGRVLMNKSGAQPGWYFHQELDYDSLTSDCQLPELWDFYCL
jgi:hypothetical protein